MSLRSRLGFTEEPLYLMDASAFVFRGFYAYRNMARTDGFPTNALYIVARLLLRLLREERPASFAFILDGRGPTFRHTLFPAYKAQRSAMPEPLALQMEAVREFPALLGLPLLISDGNEADDYIAALAARHREERPVVILGADKDLRQCLHERVTIWDPSGKDERITTLADFTEQTGMLPSSWPDYQALVGDSSDNIPGIAQVGPKTALELIRAFPTLEELFDHLPAVPPKTRVKLEGQRENALLYRSLTTLDCAACPATTLEDLTVRPMALPPVLDFLRDYELHSLVRETESMTRAGVFAGKDSDVFSLRPAPLPETRGEKPRSAPSPSGISPSTAAGDETGESPTRTSAPSSPHTPQTQASLFAAPVVVTTLPPLPVANTAQELPPLAGESAASGTDGSGTGGSGTGGSGEAVALLWLKEKLVVASAGWECLYAGTDTELAQYLSRHNTTIVTPDMKTLCKVFPALRALPAARWHDLGIAAYLLSPEDRSYAWPALVGRWAEHTDNAYSAAEHPGLLALALYDLMRARLAGAQLNAVFHELEMPLAPILACMEERGITIDTDAFTAFLQEVQAEIERLTASVHAQAGRAFNIRSSQQLSDVLFTVLGLPKAGKTRGGAASTSEEALEKIKNAHPVVPLLLEFRKLEKMRSTYLEPLPRLADADGRIHTTLNQTATATGRLSSSNPNLQNIPVRGPMGGRMRGCFIAPPGRSLVCADYSQIELRVLAHLSGEVALLDAFRSNEDIHRRTAALVFDVPQDAVTPEQRRNAKTINFGLIYGMGAQKLAQDLHIPLAEAKAFIARYFERLSGLQRFYDAVEKEARENGYVVTMAGRRRLTPDILSANNQLRSQARRQAINTRIQGSAADIIKLAMIAVEHDAVLKTLEARLLLQIHDELLLEVPEATAGAAGERLAELMSSVTPGGTPLSVPLLVDWGVGRTWAEAH